MAGVRLRMVWLGNGCMLSGTGVCSYGEEAEVMKK